MLDPILRTIAVACMSRKQSSYGSRNSTLFNCLELMTILDSVAGFAGIYLLIEAEWRI